MKRRSCATVRVSGSVQYLHYVSFRSFCPPFTGCWLGQVSSTGGGGHQPTHRPTHASPPPNWDVKVPPKNLGSKRRRWFYNNTTVVISERAGRMFLCNGWLLFVPLGICPCARTGQVCRCPLPASPPPRPPFPHLSTHPPPPRSRFDFSCPVMMMVVVEMWRIRFVSRFILVRRL